MATDAPSTSKSVPEPSHLGGIEALQLKVGPVRRNLFGSVDHQQLHMDFQRLLSMSVEAASKRWNFDFQSDTPRPGSDMEWEEVRAEDVPVFYRICAGTAKGKRRWSLSSSPEGSSSSSGSGDEYLEMTTRGSYHLRRLRKHRQASITGTAMEIRGSS